MKYRIALVVGIVGLVFMAAVFAAILVVAPRVSRLLGQESRVEFDKPFLDQKRTEYQAIVDAAAKIEEPRFEEFLTRIAELRQAIPKGVELPGDYCNETVRKTVNEEMDRTLPGAGAMESLSKMPLRSMQFPLVNLRERVLVAMRSETIDSLKHEEYVEARFDQMQFAGKPFIIRSAYRFDHGKNDKGAADLFFVLDMVDYFYRATESDHFTAGMYLNDWVAQLALYVIPHLSAEQLTAVRDRFANLPDPTQKFIDVLKIEAVLSVQFAEELTKYVGEESGSAGFLVNAFNPYNKSGQAHLFNYWAHTIDRMQLFADSDLIAPIPYEAPKKHAAIELAMDPTDLTKYARELRDVNKGMVEAINLEIHRRWVKSAENIIVTVNSNLKILIDDRGGCLIYEGY